jgi:hypothetical protein
VKPLPPTLSPLLVRVDFTNEATWLDVRDRAMAETAEGFRSDLTVVEDRDFEGQDFTKLSAAPSHYEARLVVVFDEQSRKHSDHPLLIVDFLAEVDRDDYRPGWVRAIPEQVHSVEANLSLANLDLRDFVNSADADGIFRSFR